MVCTPTSSEDSDQLKSPPNGTRAFAVLMKMFKSMDMQRVDIEGWMPKLIRVLGMHKWHIACVI